MYSYCNKKFTNVYIEIYWDQIRSSYYDIIQIFTFIKIEGTYALFANTLAGDLPTSI